jgi:transposase
MTMEKTVFMEFFGDYPLIRVLDFLIENDAFDYSKKEICEHAEVSWNTLETFWGKLEEKGIVVKTRKVGKSGMYKLNTGNAVVKKLLEIDTQLTLESLEDVKEGEAVDKALEAAKA